MIHSDRQLMIKEDLTLLWRGRGQITGGLNQTNKICVVSECLNKTTKGWFWFK